MNTKLLTLRLDRIIKKGPRHVLNTPQSFVETLKIKTNVTINNVKKYPESHQGHTLCLALPYPVGRVLSYP